MTPPDKDILVLDARDPQRPPSFFYRICPLLADLWLALVILGFFVIRLLGSNTAQHLLKSLRGLK